MSHHKTPIYQPDPAKIIFEFLLSNWLVTNYLTTVRNGYKKGRAPKNRGPSRP